MRKFALILLTVLLFVALGTAQIPTSGNIYLGYSYYNTDLSPFGRTGTNGWEGSLEGKVFPLLGIVADLSGHYGKVTFPIACGQPPCPTDDRFDTSEYNALFGPRLSVSVGRFRPFAEALFGVGHVNAHAAGSDTSFASAYGGGLDFKLIPAVHWRVEGDYVHTSFFGARQNNYQFSTGVAFHF